MKLYTQSHTCFGMERKHPEIHLLNLRKMAAHSSPHVNMSCLRRTRLKGMLFQWWLRRHRNTTYQRYQEIGKVYIQQINPCKLTSQGQVASFCKFQETFCHEHHHHSIIRQSWASDPMMMSTRQAAQTAGKLPVHQSFMGVKSLTSWFPCGLQIVVSHFLSPLGKTPGRRAPPLVGRPAWGPRIEDKHLHQW